MRKLLTLALALLALLAPLALIAPAHAAKPESPGSGAQGGISLTVHTHSQQFGGGPGGADLLFGTQPLSFDPSEGESFQYSSVSCDDPARFNDVALNFNPDYPGIEDPAPVRHLVEGTVTETTESGDRGTVEGTITTILCEGDEEGDQIVIEYEGRFRRAGDSQARFTGQFEIVGGTGEFADLSGQGSITGEFTCLPGVLERFEDADSCAELGAFSDAVFRLKGSYQDPTA